MSDAAFPLGDPAAIFRSLFASYPDGLIVVDAKGRIVLANPRAADMLGYERGELEGTDVDALVPAAMRPLHAAHRAAFAQAARARPMGHQTDLAAVRKDGSEIVVEIALSPLLDAGSSLVVAAIRDIGAYPRMAQALQRAHFSENLAHLGRLAVDARDPQALLDEVTAVASAALAVDAAVIYLQERDPQQLTVTSAVGSIRGEQPGDRIAHRPDTSLGFVLAQGHSIVVADYRSETRFRVPPAYLDAGFSSAMAVPLSDRGRTIGVFAVRSRARRPFGAEEARFLESLGNLVAGSLQRARSEEQLSHAERLESVGQLTGGIAHDFNNLLTVIQGNLQVLRERPAVAADAQGPQLLDAAMRAARRGAELTHKLLTFSRRQVLQPVAVDVRHLVDSCADMLRRTLDQRITIEVAVDARCPPVLADAAQLEAALLNIAINARDAMPQGGLLRFAALAVAAVPDGAGNHTAEEAPDAGFVAISITDTGVGMAAEVRERVFEPFFTTKTGRGTGLGLSTVYGFVKQSKGAVQVDSALGVGTTFTIYLPVLEQPSASSERPAAPRPIPAGLRALLVEDDAAVRAVIRRFLDRFGCAVTEAGSAEQAMVGAADERFDLLVSDIVLGPGMQGTELAKRLAARQPALAVVLMSGFSSELLEADRDVPAAWSLLPKPCSREELAAAIGQALDAAPG